MSNLPLPIQALIQQENLQSLLRITLDTIRQDDSYASHTPAAVLVTDFFQRVDLVFVDASVFTLEKNVVLPLLAKARDVLSSRVVVEYSVECGGKWQEADFLALAMRRYAVTTGADGEHVFYGYDLKTYKPVPDWLNPKYWANPHMWGKARW